tara:strand:+ start:398 stop:1282 length:885 start_codon:yes stop_codon:yes gene_type:complete
MINDKKMFWISSYPKSGNTWLRLILCGLFFTEDGNLNNFDLLKKIPGFDSLKNFSFVKEKSLKDYDIIFNGTEYNEESVLTFSKYWIEAQKRISIDKGKFGLFKTHNARVKINNNYYTDSSITLGFIYISRDPRDIVISYSKHINKNIDETIRFLLDGQIMKKEKIGNKMPEIILNWRDHYLSWKKFSEVPSLFLKYEDMLNNIELEIQKITNFFYKNYNIKITNESSKIKNIIKSTKFDNLKKKEFQYGFPEHSHSTFFRIGQQKQWSKILNQKQIETIEEKFKNQLIELNYI